MIDKTAVIGDKVKIGKNVTIGPFCVIGNGAVIGDNVKLKSHVVTEGRITIGNNTKIYPFASLCYPQTLQYKGEDSQIVIGKNNVIREYVTIQHGTANDKMITIIGNNCLLMVGVHIAHNCTIGNNVICANYVSFAGHVQVGDYAVLGGLAAVQQFSRIGPHTMIGGLSAVAHDVIPYGLVKNEHAHLEGLNLVGMNRRGFDKSQSLEANKAVKEIFDYSSNTVFDQRVENIKLRYKNNNIVQDIVNFLQYDKNRKFCKYKA